MTDPLRTVLWTLAIFVAGLLCGVWTQRIRPFPPPFAPMAEFDLGRRPFNRRLTPDEMRALASRFDALRPQLDAFRAELKGIVERARIEVRNVLTSTQQAQFDRQFEGPAPATWLGPIRRFRRPAEWPEAPPLPPHGGPAELMSLICFHPVVDHLNADLHLTPIQRNQIADILRARRTAVIELIDRFPPPTLTFLRTPHPPDPLAPRDDSHALLTD